MDLSLRFHEVKDSLIFGDFKITEGHRVSFPGFICHHGKLFCSLFCFKHILLQLGSRAEPYINPSCRIDAGTGQNMTKQTQRGFHNKNRSEFCGGTLSVYNMEIEHVTWTRQIEGCGYN